MQEIINRILAKKKQQDQFQPLPPEIIKNLGDWLRVELTYNSNAIEGNTLTRQQTARIIEDNLSIGGKSINEIYEAKNHNEALNLILELGKTDTKITQHDILDIHSLILKNIDDNNAGSYRSVKVRISGSQTILPNPMKVPDLMNDFESWLSQNQDIVILKAIEAHYKFVLIHPFVDGNGRTGRLLFNLILLKGGFPLSFVTKEEREEYITALEKKHLGGNENDYTLLMLRTIERSLDIYLDALDNNDKIDETALLKIGQLAKKAGISIHTVRHRTENGLLPVRDKTESGYALYHPECIDKCKIILDLKNQRYSIKDIAKML